MKDLITALQGLDGPTAEKVAAQLEKEFSGPTMGQLSRVIMQVVEAAKPAPAPTPSPTPSVTPAPAPSPTPVPKG